MRLTRRFTKEEIELFNKHSDDRIFELSDYCNRNESAHTSEIYNKLGQLEDIEEEIEIDLLTLIKALKNGIWIKDIGSDKLVNVYCYLGLDGRKELRLFLSPYGLYHHLEDYGKTWALTKEELL